MFSNQVSNENCGQKTMKAAVMYRHENRSYPEPENTVYERHARYYVLWDIIQKYHPLNWIEALIPYRCLWTRCANTNVMWLCSADKRYNFDSKLRTNYKRTSYDEIMMTFNRCDPAVRRKESESCFCRTLCLSNTGWRMHHMVILITRISEKIEDD